MSSCENNVAIVSGSTTPIIDPIFSEYEYVNIDQIYEPPSPSSHTIENDDETPQENEFEEIENVGNAVIKIEGEETVNYINSVPKEECLQDGQYGDKDSQYG